MAAKMEKTKAPGIFKRGGRYVFSYRVNGRQRWDSCRTLDEARRAKAARTTDIGRGEFDRRSRITLREYALDWIERYQGRGRRGFRDSTRDDYRRVLKQYVFKYFPERTRLTEITPSDVAGFIAWLCDPEKQGQALSDKSVRNYLGPLSACMASAVREGLIRHNPTRDADLPHRPSADDVEDEDTRAMTSEQLAALLAVIPSRHRLFFRLLAATGLRISEAIALQWRHLDLDGPSPHVKVRRGVVRGTLGPPKSRYSRREVPLDAELVHALRKLQEETDWPGEEDLVFTAGNGATCMPGTFADGCSSPPASRPTWSGSASTRSGTPAPRCCSRAGATLYRSSAGSGITRPRSRSAATSTCSTETSAKRSRCPCRV